MESDIPAVFNEYAKRQLELVELVYTMEQNEKFSSRPLLERMTKDELIVFTKTYCYWTAEQFTFKALSEMEIPPNPPLSETTKMIVRLKVQSWVEGSYEPFLHAEIMRAVEYVLDATYYRYHRLH